MNRSDLTPIITQEECAEVIQAISKVFRFGPDQCHPETGITNIEQLSTEIGQLKYMLDLLIAEWDICEATAANAYNNKHKALVKYEQFCPF